MINTTEHFATDFHEFKASTTERTDKMEHLLLENVTEYETVKKRDETTSRVVTKLMMRLVKGDKRKQSTKNHKQPEAYITNNKHEEPFQQNNAHIVPIRRT